MVVNNITEKAIEDVVDKLKKLDTVHSIILFGSVARKEKGRDIDLCIVISPNTKLSLKKRIKLERMVPIDFDLSLFDELPIDVRRRVLQEGSILYTKDRYYLFTLIKETDLKYIRYKKFKELYHSMAMKRVKERLSYG
jgi:predicted nucleotidyltransferase